MKQFSTVLKKVDEFGMDNSTMVTIGPNIRLSSFNSNENPYNSVAPYCTTIAPALARLSLLPSASHHHLF